MLPKSYQEVEWLESTGTQYIDTGISVRHTNDDSFELEFAMASNSRTQIVMGTSPSSSYQLPYLKANSAYRFRVDLAGGGYTQAVPVGEIVKISTENGHVSFLDVSSDITASLGFNVSVTLFARPSETSTYSSARVYSFKYESEYGECNLVPCYRKYDEKPGMYDTVRGMFLTNQGEGEFVTGPPVYPPIYRQTHPYEMGRRRKALIATKGQDVVFEEIPVTLTKNRYVNASGTVTAYNGWSLTDYIDVGDAEHLIVEGFTTTDAQYVCAYDQDKKVLKFNPLSNARCTTIAQVFVGRESLPEGTKYLMFSTTTSIMQNFKIYKQVTGNLSLREAS